MTAAKKLQRSPGKALSMTSPLARQMARVRETGSLDVPEKTRFLSPTAVIDSGGPFYLLQQFSTGAKKAHEMILKLYQFAGQSSIFFVDTLWKSCAAVCSRAHFRLRRTS